ncbi:MAG: GNAT family N-acetyltransferase [Solirubrobacteraceae bacterium]
MNIDLDATTRLRPLGRHDADELHALIEANRAHLMPWMPWAGQERGGTVEFLAAAELRAAAGDGLQFAVAERGRIVGTAGYHRVDWRNLATSVGYWLAQDAQGRGIVTRAVAAMLDQAFGAWELHRVEIRAATGNARSRAVAERLGFTQEGVLRDAERHADGYHDLVVYAMLAADWNRRPR